MRITIEPTEGPYDFEGSERAEFEHPKAVIELKNDDLNLREVIEYLVKPALKGFGFGEKGVDGIETPEPPCLACCLKENERLEELRELFR